MCAASAGAYEFMVGGLAYNISKNNSSEVYVTYTTTSQPTESTHSTYSGDIVIPEKVTYGGKTYTVVEVGPWAFAFCTSLTSVTFPASVTHIDSYSFNECTSLATALLPSQLYYLGMGAFRNCAQLSSAVNFPATTEFVDNTAFIGCTKVTSFRMSSNNPNFMAVSGVLLTKDGTTAYMCPPGKLGYYTIPSTVTKIGSYAFKGSRLTRVTFPPSVTKIGMNAFEGSAITTLTLPATVKEVGGSAFSGCPQLKTITLEEGIGKIGVYTFYKLPALTDVYCNAKDPWEIGTAVFETSTLNAATVHVPKGCSMYYKMRRTWENFGTVVEDNGVYVEPIRGDVNADGELNVSDVTALINAILAN